ncbi:MAG: hypothetical protein JJT77_12465 [Crocinitomicaceae bacterium]|nr:hypothetical protein [Crocinitomicaceae bacterium]
MRNIVTYIDETAYSAAYIDALNEELKQQDVLVVIYKMPSLQLEAMPMIGDLHELRKKKANKMIQHWTENISKVEQKKVYIFENRISLKEIKKDIDFSINSVVFHTPNQSSILKSLFSANGEFKNLQYLEVSNNSGHAK